MAGRTETDNKHLENLTSARFVHVPASQTDLVVRATAGRLLRVILNTNGGTVTLRNGDSDVIGIIALDAPEGTFNYGVYCSNGIQVDTGTVVDCTVVFSD
jgi:ApbE superfamily uncharacterized protein (UPF0280 family)